METLTRSFLKELLDEECDHICTHLKKLYQQYFTGMGDYAGLSFVVYKGTMKQINCTFVVKM